MTGQIEEDGLLLTCLLALESLVDSGCDCMAGFRSRDDAFCLGEQDSGFEGVELLDVYSFHETVLHQLGHDDTGAMVPEASSMDCSRLEGVAEGVHREERSETGLVAEVIFKLTAGQFGA